MKRMVSFLIKKNLSDKNKKGDQANNNDQDDSISIKSETTVNSIDESPHGNEEITENDENHLSDESALNQIFNQMELVKSNIDFDEWHKNEKNHPNIGNIEIKDSKVLVGDQTHMTFRGSVTIKQYFDKAETADIKPINIGEQDDLNIRSK